jgi:hypothetical protein
MDLSREGVVHYDEFLAVMIDWVKVEQYDVDRYHEVVDSFFNTLQVKSSAPFLRSSVLLSSLSSLLSHEVVDRVFNLLQVGGSAFRSIMHHFVSLFSRE